MCVHTYFRLHEKWHPKTQTRARITCAYCLSFCTWFGRLISNMMSSETMSLGAVQWYSTCPTWMRPWVQSPALRRKRETVRLPFGITLMTVCYWSVCAHTSCSRLKMPTNPLQFLHWRKLSSSLLCTGTEVTGSPSHRPCGAVPWTLLPPQSSPFQILAFTGHDLIASKEVLWTSLHCRRSDRPSGLPLRAKLGASQVVCEGTKTWDVISGDPIGNMLFILTCMQEKNSPWIV